MKKWHSQNFRPHTQPRYQSITYGHLWRHVSKAIGYASYSDKDSRYRLWYTGQKKTTGLKFKIIPWHLISDTLLQLMNFCSCFVIHIHVYIGKCIIPPPPSPFPFQVKIKMGTELCFSIYLKVLKFLKVTMQIKWQVY